MTEGKISNKIILFALPIFLGNLFQQMYNVVDSWVVGNFVSANALAAVSSSGSLIFLIVGFINGVFVGASVIISQYYGEKDSEKLSTAIHTTIAFGFIAGILVTAIGMFLSPVLLRLMGTPETVFPKSVLYFRLFFAGGIGMVMYNTCMGIFQAMGDSKRPLRYLIIASIVNVILDLFFVIVLKMGVAGVALATVIAQLTSGVLAFINLTHTTGLHRVTLSKIGIDKPTLIKILKLGIPTGVQNSVIAFANVIVQSNINSFGDVAMAGCGSYAKIEGFAFLPVTSFTMALTTFVGQNIGAKQFDRVKQGAKFGVITGVALAEIIGIVMWLFAPVLIGFFNDDPNVIHYGVLQLKTEGLFYCLLALSHCMAGILRGAGKTTIPMIVMLVCWCLIRITYITITVKLIPDIRVIFFAYPLTWSLSSISFVIYYFKANWLKPQAA